MSANPVQCKVQSAIENEPLSEFIEQFYGTKDVVGFFLGLHPRHHVPVSRG